MKKLREIISAIETESGKCFSVGGSVRDELLGREVYDYDIEVYNIDFDTLISVLSNFGELTVNKNFYTAKLKNYPAYEFALARKEISSGISHTDYIIEPICNMDFYNATIRRDFTVNALLKEFSSGKIIDCYGGINDLNNKQLRSVGKDFRDDSLRLLRAIRFSSQLGFEIEEETLKLCKSMVGDLDIISDTRFSEEFAKHITGECYEIGVKYFIRILSDYFSLHIYDIKDLIRINECKNMKIRTLLFFYMLKENNLELLLKRCITSKQMKKDILKVLEFDFYSIEDFICMVEDFSEEEVLLLYKFISNRDVKVQYDYCKELRKKYNAQYFIELGYSGKEISSNMKRSVITNLKGKW